MGMRPYFWALCGAVSLCVTTPAIAAPSAAAWPVKPTSAPRLRPPVLAVVPPPIRRQRPPQSMRASLEALQMARAIAQALRQPDPAPPPQAAAKPQKQTIKKSKTIKRAATRPIKRALRIKRAVRKAPPFPPPARPAEVSRPVFMDEVYVQQPGATLYGAYTKGQVVGRLPAATRVTHMGRQGNWIKVEAPNGTVGFVAARAIGHMPPNW